MHPTDQAASLSDSRVGIVRLPSADYPDVSTPSAQNEVGAGIARLGAMLGWSEAGRGPIGALIPRGSRVVVKPNWVLHENQGPWGIEPLVTHGTLIRAAVDAALAAGPSRVTVGDAPVQGCDFESLLARSAIRDWADPLAERDPRFAGVRDFRRTKSLQSEGGRRTTERTAGDLEH